MVALSSAWVMYCTIGSAAKLLMSFSIYGCCTPSLKSITEVCLIMASLLFLTVVGVIPCSSLYLICFNLLRLVSSMVRAIESVVLSAYIITRPSEFLAARPMVCINALSERKKPSLSASKIATSATSGKSNPSLNKLIPINTSKTPNLKSRKISTRSMVLISE